MQRRVQIAQLRVFHVMAAVLVAGATGSARGDDGSIVGWGQQVVGVDLSRDFVAVAAGLNHSLGLEADGSIVAWGSNEGAQCNVPAPNSGFVAVAGGTRHSLGLRADGSIVVWGHDYHGSCNVPAPNSDFVAVAAGQYHNIGLKSDGSIVAWGDNSYGQCNVPAPNSDFVAVAGGYSFSLGLKADGSIVAWGWNANGQCDVPEPNSGFVGVEGGGGHSLGLKADGSIVAWGDNSDGQCNVPAPNSGFVAVAGGCDHSLGLKADGSVVAWGLNDHGQCNVPAPNSGFVAVAGGWNFSLGLKANGSIVAWGINYFGECNVPAPNTDFVAVAAGTPQYNYAHSLCLKADSSIVAWGQNAYGQCNVPAPNSGFMGVAAGGRYSLGLRADGSIVAWGYNGSGQCNVPAPNSGFMAVAAGDAHSLGLKANGSIVAWGQNTYGQCNVPAPNSGFVAVADGTWHSLGLKADGSIVAWGRNDYAQCNVPAPNSGFVSVAGGRCHSLGLKADGSIVAWGRNDYAQCNVPAPNSGFVAVAGGGYHSLGLKANGSIVAWGADNYSQCHVPMPNSGFVAVAGGGAHSLGLKARFVIFQVSPARVARETAIRMTVAGAQFGEGATVHLEAPGLGTIPAEETTWIQSWRLDAWFDLQGASPSLYDVVVTNPDGSTARLPAGFEILEQGEPQLVATLHGPDQVRPGRAYTYALEYGNEGEAAMPAPIFTLTNDAGASMQVGAAGRISSERLTLLGSSEHEPFNQLMPGDRRTIPITVTIPTVGDSIALDLGVFVPDDGLVDWAAFEPVLRPQYVPEAEWLDWWGRATAALGSTWPEVLAGIQPILAEYADDYQLGTDFAGVLEFGLFLAEQSQRGGDSDFRDGDVTVTPIGEVDPARPCTFVITHGWMPPWDPGGYWWFVQMAARLWAHCPDCNIFLVDWRPLAGTVLPWRAKDHIADVAGDAFMQLNAYGFDWCTVTYIGHSYGNSVNKAIAPVNDVSGKRCGRAIVLDPPSPGGRSDVDFAGEFDGGSVAVSSANPFDAGPCFPYPRIIADGHLFLPSMDHGAALHCFVEQLPDPNDPNHECDNAWLNGAWDLPPAVPGAYSGQIDCDGNVVAQAFVDCRLFNFPLSFLPLTSRISAVVTRWTPTRRPGRWDMARRT